MIIILISPIVYNNFLYQEYSNYKLDSLKLDSLVYFYEKHLKQYSSETQVVTGIIDTLFPFNPNTVSFKQMILLGFDSVLVKRISKYRNKNGRFIVKKDLLKIYGFPEDLYNNIQNYIFIPQEAKDKELAIPPNSFKVKKNVIDNRLMKIRIDINLADTNLLMTVNGIGHILSNRIVKYRDLLGGYSNIDQLDDVYGLKGRSLEVLKSTIYIDSLFSPEKIEINFSDWEEMVRHPYINSKLANDILDLRSKTGFLKTIDQLHDIPYVNDSILWRIEPYIDF